MTNWTIPQLRQAADAETAARMDGMTYCNTSELLAQIGRGNLMAISGGRVLRHHFGVCMPVAAGYGVTVDLEPGDTYRVHRVRSRAGVTTVMGSVSGVYADQVGEIAYQASCFRNVEFGEHAGSLR